MKWPVVASVLAAVALAGCGGSGGSHTTSSGGSQATSGRTKPATTPHAAGRLVPVNKSVVQSAPGATRVRVTLVSYQPDVAESTGNALTPKVFGITLRLSNLSAKALSAHAPTYYAVLHLADTFGANTVANAKGPCSGSFYSRPHTPRSARRRAGVHSLRLRQQPSRELRFRVQCPPDHLAARIRVNRVSVRAVPYATPAAWRSPAGARSRRMRTNSRIHVGWSGHARAETIMPSTTPPPSTNSAPAARTSGSSAG